MKQIRQLLSLTLLFTLFVALNSFGQPPRGKMRAEQNREKIQQLKIAYFTKELDLSTEQAEKFWPIYNEMSDKVNEQKRKAKKASRDVKNGMDSMSESEIKSKMNEALDARIEESKLQKEYLGKIGDVIGYKKAAKVVSLEVQFKRELLKRLADERNGNTNATEEK